jgi:hypothetical protein
VISTSPDPRVEIERISANWRMSGLAAAEGA